jgi:hypothetical protein
VIEKDRRTLRMIVLKNHRTTPAQVTPELNIHIHPVSTKTALRFFHKSNIHGRAEIAKPLITESDAQLRKQWSHDHESWTSDNWKRARDMVR